jgi:dihydrodipicolinate synthase/N-acetylneuraminate lyase
VGNYDTQHVTSFAIDGVVPIIPTPFTAVEQIDWKSLRDLIDFACAADVCAVCLPAYASEFYKLSEDERGRVLSEAISHASGRLPVIAQVNSPSAALAAELAARAQDCGANAICAAVPRLFPLREADIRRFFEAILNAIEVPLIIQDFNPGGQSMSPGLIAALHAGHPQFRYVKLEEPMMAAKVEAIRQETNGGVGVLEGWGGMYMMELVPAGISGVVPGLALADVLARVYHLLSSGHSEPAYEIFQVVLPQIVFSLQNLELFHHAEKLLLQARGILPNAVVREAALRLSSNDEQYIRFLNGRILGLLDYLELPRNPAAGSCSAVADALD